MNVDPARLSPQLPRKQLKRSKPTMARLSRFEGSSFSLLEETAAGAAQPPMRPRRSLDKLDDAATLSTILLGDEDASDSFSSLDDSSSSLASSSPCSFAMDEATEELDQLSPKTLDTIVQAWKQVKTLYHQKKHMKLHSSETALEDFLGDKILQRARHELPQSLYQQIFGGCATERQGSFGSTNDLLMLHIMASHMRAARIGSMVVELLNTLEKDVSEFLTLLCTQWRQQYMMGWKLNLTHIAAFCQTLALALEVALSEGPTTNSKTTSTGPLMPALAQFSQSICLEMQVFEGTFGKSRRASC